VHDVAGRLGIPPQRCAVIGDIGIDVEAARAAGARGILVPTAATRRGGDRRRTRAGAGPARRRRPPAGGPAVKPHVLVARQDREGDVLLAGPAIRAIAAGARAGHAAVRAAGRAGGPGLLPGVDRVLVAHAGVDRRRAAARRPGPDRAPRRGRAGGGAGRGGRADLVSTRARCRWRCCCAWPACPGSARPRSITRARCSTCATVSPTMTPTRSSGRCRLAAAMGFSCPRATTGAWWCVPARLHRRPFGGGALRRRASRRRRWPARAWEPGRHAELADALLDRGTNVAVTGAPGERDLTAAVARAPRDGIADLGGRTSLRAARRRPRPRRRGRDRQHRPGAPRGGGRHSGRLAVRARPCPRPAGAPGASLTSCCSTRCFAPAAARVSARCRTTLACIASAPETCLPRWNRLMPARARWRAVA